MPEASTPPPAAKRNLLTACINLLLAGLLILLGFAGGWLANEYDHQNGDLKAAFNRGESKAAAGFSATRDWIAETIKSTNTQASASQRQSTDTPTPAPVAKSPAPVKTYPVATPAAEILVDDGIYEEEQVNPQRLPGAPKTTTPVVRPSKPTDSADSIATQGDATYRTGMQLLRKWRNAPSASAAATYRRQAIDAFTRAETIYASALSRYPDDTALQKRLLESRKWLAACRATDDL